MGKISTFDDWTDYFRQWQKDIGLDTSKFEDYKFEVKFGPVPSDVIEGYAEFSRSPQAEKSFRESQLVERIWPAKFRQAALGCRIPRLLEDIAARFDTGTVAGVYRLTQCVGGREREIAGEPALRF